jgi:hypothetical protein
MTGEMSWDLRQCDPTTGCSRIIVRKDTDPDDVIDEFDFAGAINGSIGDDEELALGVAPGTYTVSEQQAKPGWRLKSIECSDGNSTGNIATGTATFDVSQGETVVCQFTNEKVCDFRVLFVEHDATAFPGFHLFDFDTLVRYNVCPDNSVNYLGSAATGVVDPGKTTAVLEQFGFDFRYDGSDEPVGDIDSDPLVARVPISGTFFVDFDWGGLAAQWLIGRALEPLKTSLPKRLENKTPAQRTGIVLTDIDLTIQQIRARLSDLSTWLINHGVPESISQFMEEALTNPTTTLLQAWRDAVASADLTRLNPIDIAGLVIQELLNRLAPPMPYPVWEPAIMHTMTAFSGVGVDQGPHNPFLLITAHSEVKTG